MGIPPMLKPYSPLTSCPVNLPCVQSRVPERSASAAMNSPVAASNVPLAVSVVSSSPCDDTSCVSLNDIVPVIGPMPPESGASPMPASMP